MSFLSKTTLSYAAKRGFELVSEGDCELAIFEAEVDTEPMFIIRMVGGEFFFGGNVYLPQAIKEELPYWMKDEKALRSMLNFVNQQRGNQR
jgi:hypothetical protein